MTLYMWSSHVKILKKELGLAVFCVSKNYLSLEIIILMERTFVRSLGRVLKREL